MKTTFKGISLLEMALAMAIISILMVSVSSLVRSGIEAQHTQRAEEMMQMAAGNIVDDLRFDLWAADQATMVVAPTQLRFTNQMSGNLVTYRLNGTQMERREGVTTKVYNNVGYSNGGVSMLDVACSNPCFRLVNTGNSEKIVIDTLTVQTNLNDTTLIGQHFGPPQYSLQNMHFDITSAKTFN